MADRMQKIIKEAASMTYKQREQHQQFYRR